MTVLKAYILHCCNFVVCGCGSGSFNFDHDCGTCVSVGREPKLSISNKILKFCC